MSLQDLGNIGEFLAAIATLATLIYLAMQIRQNSETVKAAAEQSILTGVNAALQNAASTPELARAVIVGQADFDQLADEEQHQFLVWCFSWFRTMENAYHNYLLGRLDGAIWDGHARHLAQVSNTQAVRTWWEHRKLLFSREFQEFVSGLEPDHNFTAPGKMLRTSQVPEKAQSAS